MRIAAVIQDVWTIYEVVNERGDGPLSAVKSADEESLIAFLDRAAIHGPEAYGHNRCHHVCNDPKIYQFDCRGTLRLLWFYAPGNSVILSHSFYKSGKKTDPQLIKAAQAAHAAHAAAKAANTLEVIEIKEDEDEDQ